VLLRPLTRAERPSSRVHGTRAAQRDAATPPRGHRGPTSSGLAEVRTLLWAHRGRLLLGLAMMLLGRGAALVLPASSKFLVDDVIGRGQWDLLPTLALALGIASIVQAATGFALSQLLGVAAQRAIAELRTEIHRHILHLPVRHFDATSAGALVSRIMSDPEGIRNLVGSGLVQLTSAVVTATLSLAVLFYLNWRLTLVTAAMLAVFGGGLALGFRRLRPIYRERNAISADMTGRLTEVLGGMRTVKAYTAERREEQTFSDSVQRHLRNVTQALTGASAVSAFSTLVIGGIAIAMLLMGGMAIRHQQMTVGDFAMYVAFTGLVTLPLTHLAGVGSQFSEAVASLDRIREVRALATEEAETAGMAAVQSLRGDVEFDRVSFAYTPGVPVLREVSFTAAAGSMTALVGPSGSGKSTLASLVMALNRPADGVVRVDGVDLAGLRLREYRQRIGVVFQDNFLFDGTIADNIAYARPDAPRAEVAAAGRLAHCDEFVEGFADGYDTVVGERGVRLSGGQRQRVAIARAILADPTILILDEATSSLDARSEAAIQEGLRTLRKGRTTFVIAHRLSTIRSADQILVLEGGHIVERGTHDELLARGGRYRELYRQHDGTQDRFLNPGESAGEARQAD